MSELGPIAVEPIHFECLQLFFVLARPKCFALGRIAPMGQSIEAIEHQVRF
jgi:hypothetical protein